MGYNSMLTDKTNTFLVEETPRVARKGGESTVGTVVKAKGPVEDKNY